MLIINGIRRYLPEKGALKDQIKKRYGTSDAPRLEMENQAIKRYVKGQGPSAPPSIRQESTRKFIPAFEFEVWVGLVCVNFSKITNMESKTEPEFFVEGGNNDYPIIRHKPSRQPSILVLEKGLTDTAGGTVFSAMREGVKLTGILIFVRHARKLVKIFTIDEAMILSKKFSDLDANASSVLVEKLELAHTGLKEMPVP